MVSHVPHSANWLCTRYLFLVSTADWDQLASGLKHIAIQTPSVALTVAVQPPSLDVKDVCTPYIRYRDSKYHVYLHEQ